MLGFRRDRLDTVVHLQDGRWGVVVVPRERSIDIDDEVDFLIVTALLDSRQRVR